MGEYVQVVLGAAVLAGFWWAVFAALRMIDPDRPRGRGSGPVGPFPPDSPQVHPPARGQQQPWQTPRSIGSEPDRSAASVPCCPDCSPDCQTTGLAMGQAWGRGDSWLGKPFDDDGINTEAAVFWGDDCCPDCWRCPICNGDVGRPS